MKNGKQRVPALLLAALSGLCLIACGKDLPPVPTAETELTASPTPAPTPTPVPTPSFYTVLGKEVSSSAEELDLRGIRDEDCAETAKTLALMPALRVLRLGSESETPLSWENLRLLHEACPEADLDYAFTMWDRELNLSDSVLDLKYIKMSDEGEAVDKIAHCMAHLQVLDMDSCEVSNEAMAALRDSLPETEVIWRVNFGRYYTARTNVEKILASQPGRGGNLVHNNVMSLQYCTKLKYLDLGHNNYLDTVEFCRTMPDLEVLIVGMTFVEDFSPLAECKNLEYLEVMTTRLHDLRPFAGLKKLRHLNIAYNFAVRDLTPLYGLTGLERLWIGMYNPIPPEQIAEFKRLVPNCEVNDTTPDPTEEGWRFGNGNLYGGTDYVPRYALLRQQFDYQEGDAAYAYQWNDPLYDYTWHPPVVEPDGVNDFTPEDLG